MTDEANTDQATHVEPAEDPKGENVAIEAAEAACKQAASDADDRADIELAWDDVIETPVMALTIETFSGRIGETFVVDLGHFHDEVELVEVNKLGDAVDLGTGTPGRVPFEAVFKDLTERTRLPEGMYRLRNDGVGEVEVYLTPEGANHNRLIATFC